MNYRDALHRISDHFQFTATIFKRRLVHRDTTINQRLIHLDRGREDFTVFMIGHHYFTGEQFWHTRGVVIDDETLELNREWQVLDQHTILLRNNRGTTAASFRDQRIATKSWIA